MATLLPIQQGALQTNRAELLFAKTTKPSITARATVTVFLITV